MPDTTDPMKDVKLMSIYPSSRGWETGSQDWEIVSSDWWRTHYSSVSWVYIQHPPEHKTFHRRQYQGSLFLSPLLGTRRRRSRDDVSLHGETALNVELVGIKHALEALLDYERNVGFYYQAFPKLEPEDIAALMALNLSTRIVNVEDTTVHQVRWNELLTDLMHSPLPESPSESDEASELAASSSSVGDSLLHSTSTLSSVDLTSSEGSLESQPMPSTPRPKSSHHPIDVKDTSPTGSIRISPIRPLSASASSFFPTSSSHLSHDHSIKFPLIPDSSRRSSKLSSFADFVFPSLNPPVSSSNSPPSVKLKKDRDGFFTEEGSNTTPTPLLPPFLQESSQRNTRIRKSRTREIVDRLKSESAPNEEKAANLQKGRNTVSPKFASYSPSPQLLDDFALSLIKPRRTVSEDGSGEQRQHRPSVSTTSFSASVSASASASTSRLSTPEMEDDDGWIDVSHPASSPKDKLKRTRELFLALTRRRADSISSEVLNEAINQITTQASDGPAAAVTEDMSLSSAPSPPSTPPRTDIIRSVSASPPIARIGAEASNNVWKTRSIIAHEKIQQQEKTPKKESHWRKKSQNSNPGHNTPLWARGSTFQPTPPSMPPLHPLHPPNLPFQPSSTSAAFSHPALAPHVMPQPSTTGGGPGAMPYFFPSYPMSLRIPPVSPVSYPTAAYSVMHIPNAYPMPPPPPPVPLQQYVAGLPPFAGVPPGGYALASQASTTTTTSMSATVKTPGFTTVHSNTVAVPIGVGYNGLNGSKGKW